MDLWIRTQKKLDMFKVDNIQVMGCDIYTYTNDGNYTLGEYETTERALEVLDKIQCLITKSSRVAVHTPVKNKEVEKAFDVECCEVYIPNETPIIYPINQQCVVYQMPEE